MFPEAPAALLCGPRGWGAVLGHVTAELAPLLAATRVELDGCGASRGLRFQVPKRGYEAELLQVLEVTRDRKPHRGAVTRSRQLDMILRETLSQGSDAGSEDRARAAAPAVVPAPPGASEAGLRLRLDSPEDGEGWDHQPLSLHSTGGWTGQPGPFSRNCKGLKESHSRKTNKNTPSPLPSPTPSPPHPP